jgi:hypothetical protein
MAEPKTKPTAASVAAFIAGIKDPGQRRDAGALVKLMRGVTRKQPKMWGSSIVGFGSYHYVYASGREGDWPVVAFSPRKGNTTVYIMNGFSRYRELLRKLGKHRTSVSCLYLRSLEDVDMTLLKAIVADSVREMHRSYPVPR